MLNLKSVLSASLFAVSAMAASSAFAYTPAPSNTNTGTGPTSLSYGGLTVPCHSYFNIVVSAAGVASINGATFTQQTGDSNLCTHITPNLLPWPIGAASPVSGSPGVYTATIGTSTSPVSVTVPGVATCKGTATITLNNNTGVASFTGTLYNGTTPCTVNGSGLTTTVKAP